MILQISLIVLGGLLAGFALHPARLPACARRKVIVKSNQPSNFKVRVQPIPVIRHCHADDRWPR